MNYSMLYPWLLGSFIVCSILVSDLKSEPKIPTFIKSVILFGDKRINVEIASTPEQQKYGLMFRDYLPVDNGMLFVFKTEKKRCFWMKDTSIPLDIAYFDTKRRLFQITPMEPFSNKCVESKKKAMFALEMNRGWFNNIKGCSFSLLSD